MKTFRHLLRNKRGVALLLVISTIAILAMLVIAFLSVVRTENRSSDAFALSTEVRELSELPVNLVIGQIRKATEGNGETKTWASQPGMIRVYGTKKNLASDARARLEEVYRLYSARQLVTAGSAFTAADELPPATWATDVAHFTDLNQPVLIDPANNGNVEKVYPVLQVPDKDRATGKYVVEGFDLEAGSIATAAKNEPVMPVRWLYQTRDGQMISPTGGSGTTAVFDSAIVTAENPIVSRIAFWADDDCSKVNLNTANEGVFWTPPYCLNRTERCNTAALSDYPQAPYGYAMSMPLRNEYQRLPGHPSNTSLSAVLKKWLPVDASPTFAQLDPYCAISPRVANGGSEGGTKHTGNGANVQLLPIDNQRMYPTMGELFFAGNASGAGNRTINPAMTRQVIQQTRFFLTPHSRAPETNVFNQPRISLWPMMQDPLYRNGMEKLIAFCSTTNNNPYFWQRKSYWTSYSSPGSAQSPTEEYTGIARNKQLYEYLDKLMSKPVPGFGPESFQQKYQTDQPQIATEIFDYIRSQVSTVPDGNAPNYWYSAARPNWAGLGAAAPGEGSVVNLKIGDTMGAGRNITITEGALVIHAARDPAAVNTVPPLGRPKFMRAVFMIEPFSPSIGHPSWSPNMRFVIRGLDQFKINSQSLGFSSVIPIVGEVPIGYFDSDGHVAVAHTGFFQLFRKYSNGRNSSANVGRRLGSDEFNDYSLYGSVTLPVPPGKDTMDFKGGAIVIEVRTSYDSSPGQLIQTINMNFEDSVWPIPQIASPDGSNPPYLTDFNERMNVGSGFDYRQRILARGDIVRSVEASSAMPLGGDLRLISYSNNVPSSFYKVHNNYHLLKEGSFPALSAHSLRNDKWNWQGQIGWLNNAYTSDDIILNGNDLIPPTWFTGGALVPNFVHFRDNTPVVASGLNGANRSGGGLGDWETGYGVTPDGCYIRKIGEASTTGGRFGDGGYYWNIQNSVSGGIDQSLAGGGNALANFHPNRQMVGPVQLGALPSAVKNPKPFQTLLFCPNPNGRNTAALEGSGKIAEPTAADHPGFAFPRDHLLLDYFWMPAVEPYAISEPFSTAGKINLNYEIMPFRYIKRRTGIQALLSTVKICAMPKEIARDYMGGSSYKQGHPTRVELRHPLNLDPVTGTLRGFEERFKSGDIFHAASELCEIFLIPKRKTTLIADMIYFLNSDPTYSNIVEWWKSFQLTGDNAREDVYSHIYGRTTTKSNTFTVHYRVQVLKKARSGNANEWIEGRDLVAAEHRGQCSLERYVDPNDSSLPDFATAPNTSADDYYRFRVISRKQFAP